MQEPICLSSLCFLKRLLVWGAIKIGTTISQTFSDYEIRDIDGSFKTSVQPSCFSRNFYYSRICMQNKQILEFKYIISQKFVAWGILILVICQFESWYWLESPFSPRNVRQTWQVFQPTGLNWAKPNVLHNHCLNPNYGQLGSGLSAVFQLAIRISRSSVETR